MLMELGSGKILKCVFQSGQAPKLTFVSIKFKNLNENAFSWPLPNLIYICSKLQVVTFNVTVTFYDTVTSYVTVTSNVTIRWYYHICYCIFIYYHNLLFYPDFRCYHNRLCYHKLLCWSERRCADGFVESAVGHYFW